LATPNAEVLSDEEITEDDECKLLNHADTVVAIQWDEADFVQRRLPSQHVIVARWPHILSLLRNRERRSGSVRRKCSCADVDGLKWFLDHCWPRILERKRNARFFVAGTLSQVMGPAPDGVRFVGFVNDLGPLYKDAGVIVSPLRVGSGLKTSLSRPLGRGKPL